MCRAPFWYSGCMPTRTVRTPSRQLADTSCMLAPSGSAIVRAKLPYRNSLWPVFRSAVSPLAANRQLASAGLAVHGEFGHAVYGYGAREIISLARAHDAGVIVMGSRGRGDLAGLLVGSTAHKVIHLSDRPVVVVR